jgi:hypothetical protein
MVGVRNSVSCRELFKKFIIHLLASDYVQWCFIVLDNIEKFKKPEIRSENRGNRHIFHVPDSELTSYQKGVYFALQESNYLILCHLTLKF